MFKLMNKKTAVITTFAYKFESMASLSELVMTAVGVRKR